MSGFACFCSIFCKYSANFCWLFWGKFLFPPVWFSVINVFVMETDNNEIKQAIQTDIETGDGILSRAAEIARGGPCTGADVASGTQRRGARVVAHDQRRQQDARLIEWARASNRLIDNDAFQHAVDAQGDDDPSRQLRRHRSRNPPHRSSRGRSEERDGQFLVHTNEETLLDMLSPEDREGMVGKTTRTFSTEAERNEYLRKRGWL